MSTYFFMIDFTKTKYSREFTREGKFKFTEKDSNYVRIPKTWLESLSNLSASEKYLLLLLKSYKGRDGLIYPSQMTLAKVSGFTRVYVNQKIKSLKRKKAIETERKGNRWYYKILV